MTASLNDTVIQTTQVSVGSQNVEQDFLTNGPWDGRTREQVLASVTPQPAAPTPTPVAPAPTPAAPVTPVAITVIPDFTVTPSSTTSWTSWKANTV